MPRMGKSSLSRNTKKARTAREKRRYETPEQTRIRREANATSTAARRARETPEQTQIRREANATAIAARRARKTREQTQLRLSNAAQARAAKRSNMSHCDYTRAIETPSLAQLVENYCAQMNSSCGFCGSKNFIGGTQTTGHFTWCRKGKVDPSQFASPAYPDFFKELLCGSYATVLADGMEVNPEVVVVKAEPPEEHETSDVTPEVWDDPQNNVQAQVVPKTEDVSDVDEESATSSGLPVEKAGHPEDPWNVKVKWLDELEDGPEEEHEDVSEDPLSGPVAVNEETADDDAMETVVSRSADLTPVKEEGLADEFVEECKMPSAFPLAAGEPSSKNQVIKGGSRVEMASGTDDVRTGRTGQSLITLDVRDQSDQESFSCDKCSYSCEKQDELSAHMKSHTADKPYFCALCENRFRDFSRLKRHMRIHTGEKPYACDVCKSRFRDAELLKRHMRIHTGERPYACDVCDSKFKDFGHLATHKRIHTGEKPYVCTHCKSKFSRRSLLTIHVRIHTGEKPYKCEFCNYSSSQGTHLQTHMRIHTGEKPFSCDVCNAKFSHAFDVKVHKRAHTGEKPYVCDVCDTRFARGSTLRDHKRIHTGEKPFVCEVCESAFSLASSLSRHRKTHTAKNVTAKEHMDKDMH